MLKPKLAIIKRGGATVSTNVGTKQALLPPVPTGKKRIVTEVTVRNPSVDISSISDDMVTGFQSNNGVTVSSAQLSEVGSTSWATTNSITSGNTTVGVEGDVFGCTFLDASIDGTVDVDIFFYDI